MGNGVRYVPSKRASVTIETNNGPVLLDVEVADTRPRWERGLMFRHTLSGYHGMILLLDGEQQVELWMKNTHIALDIVFIGSDWSIVHIAPNAAPLSTDIISSERPASRVLEIAAGQANKLGLNIGDAVSHQRPPIRLTWKRNLVSLRARGRAVRPPGRR